MDRKFRTNLRSFFTNKMLLAAAVLAKILCTQCCYDLICQNRKYLNNRLMP